MRYTAALALVLMASAAPLPALAETLLYQGTNKWVAAENNAPLRALITKAKAGQTNFTVTLPEANRALSVVRLEIVSDILDKASPKGGVVLTEVSSGTAAANTIEIVAN